MSVATRPGARAMKSSTPPDGARTLAELPRWIEPLAPTEVTDVPAGAQLAEIKWDGFRAIVTKDGDRVRAWTRNDKELTGHIPTVIDEVRRLPCRRAIFDGELCVLAADGHSQFHLVPSAFGPRASHRPTLMAFDLLALDDHDLRPVAIEARKHALARLLAASDTSTLRNVEAIAGNGREIFEYAARTGLEGIVFKQPGSPYASGRSRLWLKLKCRQAQPMLVGGYRPAGPDIAELLVGVLSDGVLYYVGSVSTGLGRVLDAIAPRLENLRQPAPSFEPRSLGSSRGIWVRPEIAVLVKFTATSTGRMRHPSILGLAGTVPPGAAATSSRKR